MKRISLVGAGFTSVAALGLWGCSSSGQTIPSSEGGTQPETGTKADSAATKDAAADRHSTGLDAGHDATHPKDSGPDVATDAGRDSAHDGGHDGGVDAAMAICNGAITADGAVPGALDPTFNNSPVGLGAASARELLQDSLGRIYLVGTKNNCVSATSNIDFAVTRLQADGQIDPTFGTVDSGEPGTVCVDFVGGADLLGAAAFDAAGNLVLVGMSTIAPSPASQPPAGFYYTARLGIARMLPSGALDTTFNTTGKLRLSTGTGPSEIQWGLGAAIDLEGDQGIYVVGTTQALPVPAAGATTANYAQLAGWVAKVSPTGAVNTVWGSGGFEADDSLTELTAAVVSNGALFVVGADKGAPDGGAGRHFVTRKYKTAGAGGLDTTFSSGDGGLPGDVRSAPGKNDYGLSVIVDGAGNVIVGGMGSVGAPALGGGGFAAGPYGGGYAAAARYLPSGKVDPTFNDGGLFLSSALKGFPAYEANMLAVQCDGKILLGALVDPAMNVQAGVQSLAVLRLSAEGKPDPKYGDGDGGVGITSVSLGANSNVNSLILDPKQRAIVVSGTQGAGSVLTRFLP